MNASTRLPDRIPPGVVNLADYERLAAERLSPATWAWLDGAAGDELTRRANRNAWDGLWLQPRVLRALSHGHTRIELFGRTWPHPVLVAPVAYQRAVHPDGELATAYAAAAQGAGLVLSLQASTPLEAVARAMQADAGRGPLWMQLYWHPDRGWMRELLARIEAAGYEALVLTVDAPVSGVRDRERRQGPGVPPEVRAVNLAGQPHAPRPTAGESEVFDRLALAAPVWDDVAWLASQTRLPLLLKGVLRADDARQARAAGASGLVVSNHGGRTLDTALPTARALPQVVEAVGDAIPVLVDGGIRRGTDVLKALALGARAVLVGRPLVCALACAGALGVAHALRLLRDELEAAMASCGCATLEQIDPTLLWRAEDAR
ncbi:MAG TPA: alpha-hydroxy acid oxidase [Burkholderiaceae bacterium]|uniref:alpha-hydroxy acid oxidase n=1 Tax=Caldimonas aquatica TaxID=376175 RepID=UPI002C3ED02D|nr:alpha-hydroxy acid oxidase [Burkholderiaceae bacterium]